MTTGKQIFYLSGRLCTHAQWAFKLGREPLIVSAGMPRSGSTLLFNVVRELLMIKWERQLTAGWEGDFLSLPPGKAYLVKTHKFNSFSRLRSKRSFYSYRDIRSAIASRIKKTGKIVGIEFVRRHIKQYQIARRHCDVCFSYERLTKNLEEVVIDVARSLGIPCDPERIRSKVMQLPLPGPECRYSPVTLLHPNHFTQTSPTDWRRLLPESLQQEIGEEFAWWFEECGYEL